MRNWRIGPFLVAVWIAVVPHAPARADILPPLPLDQLPAWRAIGVVNGGGALGRADCSGALIAPDLVLTAAHCAGSAQAKRQFLVGGIGGQTISAHPVREIMLHPDYANRSGIARYEVDMAVLRLVEPVPAVIAIPLPLSRGLHEGPHGIIAFHRLRPGVPSARFDCENVAATQARLILDCQVIAGNSGAPALMREGTGPWQVAGVVVARLDGGGRRQALVARPNDWLRAMLEGAGN